VAKATRPAQNPVVN